MKIHPLTIIIMGMLLISLGFNVLQHRTILELKEKKKTVIIKPNIRLYEPSNESIFTGGRKGFDYN